MELEMENLLVESGGAKVLGVHTQFQRGNQPQRNLMGRVKIGRLQYFSIPQGKSTKDNKTMKHVKKMYGSLARGHKVTESLNE